MPGPENNLNARKHGGRSNFPLVKLPKGHGYIDRDVSGIRRRLIDAVNARHGQLSMSHDSKIGLAVGYEQGRQYIGKSVRDNGKATLAEKIAAREYQDDAARKRDRAIESLGLDTSPSSAPTDPRVLAAEIIATGSRNARQAPQPPAAPNGSIADPAPENAAGATPANGAAHHGQ